MTESAVPATPSTPAQRERYDRVLAAATGILSVGGEGSLQMKDLARSADVSLATLYRYFPSKEYLLLALSLARYEAAVRKVLSERPSGDSPRERVTNHLLREFRSQQRNLRLTAALTNAVTQTDSAHSYMIEAIAHLHQQILQHVANGDAAISAERQRLLPVIIDIFGSASRRWLNGMCSAAEARFQIRVGCHLLDLSDEQIAAEFERGALVGDLAGTGPGWRTAL